MSRTWATRTLVILLVLAQVAVTAVRAWLGVYLSTQINLRLLDSLFGQLLRLPLAWFEKRHIGDIVSRFRSVDAIQRTLTLTFVETVIDGAMVLLTLAVMFWYSAQLTLIVTSYVVLSVLTLNVGTGSGLQFYFLVAATVAVLILLPLFCGGSGGRAATGRSSPHWRGRQVL